jgi:hypothetical protein
MFLLRRTKQERPIGTILQILFYSGKNVKYSMKIPFEQKTDYENWF